MTEEQIEMLRFLINEEIELARMTIEDDPWGYILEKVTERWEKFKKSFKAQ